MSASSALRPEIYLEWLRKLQDEARAKGEWRTVRCSGIQVPMTLSSEEAKRVIAKDGLLEQMASCAASRTYRHGACEQELKIPDIDSLLTGWQDEPIGTASIGQVYKAPGA